MKQRVIVILAVALVATLAVAGVLVVSGLLRDDAATRAVLDARETAARDTVVVNVRSQLSVVKSWTVLSVVAEAAYYTQGKDPVHSRWGLESQGTIAGEDAGPIIEAVNDAPVRFLVVGQCAGTPTYTTAVAFAPGLAPVTEEPPAGIAYATFDDSVIACDGHAHAAVSNPYSIPLSAAPEGQWARFWFSPSEDHASTADRAVLFVALAETPVPDLTELEALAERAFGGPLP